MFSKNPVLLLSNLFVSGLRVSSYTSLSAAAVWRTWRRSLDRWDIKFLQRGAGFTPGRLTVWTCPKKPLKDGVQEASWSDARTTSDGPFWRNGAGALLWAPSWYLSSSPYLWGSAKQPYKISLFRQLLSTISFHQSPSKVHDQRGLCDLRWSRTDHLFFSFSILSSLLSKTPRCNWRISNFLCTASDLEGHTTIPTD